MGLTRIRAEQISDIDYKQAVRVITVANVTLSGGAPNSVDGVNLAAGDRVLVTAQSPGSQNGIYVVTTLGTGSNGTWIRSIDGNETGEIEAGMIIMVTEGDVYKDTQWKLTTNNPIVIGTTPLTFEQNSAFAFGNIYANGTAVLANSVGSTVTITPGDNISITGNNTSKTVTIAVTGISLNSISNGTSNVNVVSSGGNVTVGIGGTSDIAVFSTSGLDVTGRVSATGNVTGGNLVTGGLITATGNITGGNLSGTSISGTLTTAAQTNITSVGTLSSLSVSGNITGGNISTAGMLSGATLETTSNAIIGGNLTVNGNVVYVNITDLNVQDPIIGLGRGANNAPLTTDDGKDRGEQLWYYTDSEKSAFIGYDNSADKLIAALDVSIVNEIVTVNSYGSFVVGTLESTTASASGNITGGNLLTGGLISSTGNITSGNIITGGLISATGNITGGNILGNGAGLSGINAFSNISVSGGNSVTADSISDTLTLTAGDGITLVADAGNNIITIAQAGSGDSIFATGGDMGTVTETVTASEDLGLITTVAATEIDMGTVVTSGLLYPDQLVLPTKTVAQLANTSASPAGQFVFCSNESGGSIPAFSDGTNWRRVSDRAIVT